MDNWLATTETGAKWRFIEDRLYIKSSRPGNDTAFMPFTMKIIDRDNLPKGATVKEAIELGVDSFTPVVGQAIYAWGKDEWRLSTRVVSLEELPNEEA